MLKRRKTYGRRAAACVVCACANVALAGTPSFTGNVTISHDVDAGTSTTAAGYYKTVTVTPPLTAPTNYQLDTFTNSANWLHLGSGSSTATATVLRVENATNLGVTLAAGTGVAQKDASHVVGDSVLKFTLNDLTWTPNALYGPPGYGYVSVIVGGTVNGTSKFSANLVYTDELGNKLRPDAVLGPATYTSSGQLPQAFTSQVKFTPSSVSAPKEVHINGTIEFRANNGIDDTSSLPIAIEAAGAPPTATWYSSSGGNWSDAANWTAPAGSVIEDPDGTIPTLPDGIDERRRFVVSGPQFDESAGPGEFGPTSAINLDIPVKLGTLDVDGVQDPPFVFTGSSTLTMETTGQDLNQAVISHRGAQGRSQLQIQVPVVLNSPTQIMAYSTGGIIFSGPVSGGQTIEKHGPGNVVFNNVAGAGLIVADGAVGLTGNGQFTSVTVNDTGTLSLGDGIAFGGSVNTGITNNGVVEINRPDSMTMTNGISGSGSVIKNGAGAATFAGGAKTYTGSTTINAGSLIIATNVASNRFNVGGGTLHLLTANPFPAGTVVDLAGGEAANVTAFSPYNTPSNLTLTGTGGTVYGNVSHGAGTIEPGGTLATGDLNFANDLAIAGGNLVFDLSSTNTIGSGVNDLIGVNGNLALNSGNVYVNFLNGSSGAGTSYRLINYGGSLTGSPSNLTLVNNTRGNLALTNPAAGQIDLQVISAATPLSLTWTGLQAGSIWDVNNNHNWLSAVPDKFYAADSVTFDDTAVASAVNLSGQLQPSSILVNSSVLNYSFGGSGQIVGNTGLTKAGTSVLSIAGDHFYRGPTVINGGVVSVPRLTNGGAASPIGASDNTATSLILNGGALQYTGAGAQTDRLFSVGTSGGAIDASGTGPLALINTDPIGFNSQTGARTLNLKGSNTGANTLAASIGDNGGATGVVKSGSGKWTLSGSSSYTGTTTISAGALIVNGIHTAGGAYSVASGAKLGGDGLIDAQVNVNSGGIISPGDNSVGFLSVASLSLGGANYNVELTSSGADLLSVYGANGLSLTSSTVSLTNLNRVKPGTYPILDYEGSPLGNLSQLTLTSPTLGNLNVALVNNTADTSVDLLVTAPSGSWNASSGLWSSAANWIGPVPSVSDHVANLLNAASPVTVTLDAPKTVGVLNLQTTPNSPGSFNITGAATLTLDAGGADVAINVLSGNHSISAPIKLNRGTTVNVAQANSLLNFTGSVSSTGAYIMKEGLGTAQFKKVDVAGLQVFNGHLNFTVKATANTAAGTSVIKALGISPGGQIDLANNSMVEDYIDIPAAADSPLQNVRGYLLTTRLTSSLNTTTRRVGYADNEVLGLPSFSGVGVDLSSILIKQTWAGDLDLNDQVNLADLTLFAAHWMQTGTYWQFGDFTYDGIVNELDLKFFESTWQSGVVPPSGQTIYDAVVQVGLPLEAIPEPTALAGIAICMAAGLGRRKRK